MSLLPLLIEDSWEALRPPRFLNEHYGLPLQPEDLFSPLSFPAHARFVPRRSRSYYRPWCSLATTGDTGSLIKADKEKFEVNLDVQQFTPDEVSVTVTANDTITVEGKHEERQDEHGFVSRHFVRKYILPDGHDINGVVSKLSSDGVLSIAAPKIRQEAEMSRVVPIQQTGTPAKSVPQKPQEQPDICQRPVKND